MEISPKLATQGETEQVSKNIRKLKQQPRPYLTIPEKEGGLQNVKICLLTPYFIES